MRFFFFLKLKVQCFNSNLFCFRLTAELFTVEKSDFEPDLR